ncbi:hypothetical protein ABEV16_10080, partial [Geobacillus stearothermophilus]
IAHGTFLCKTEVIHRLFHIIHNQSLSSYEKMIVYCTPRRYHVFFTFPHCPQPMDKNMHNKSPPDGRSACQTKKSRPPALSDPLYEIPNLLEGR